MDETAAQLRIAVEAELARAGIVRAPQEVAHLVAERAALERDVDRCRDQLSPVLGPDRFVQRLASLAPPESDGEEEVPWLLPGNTEQRIAEALARIRRHDPEIRSFIEVFPDPMPRMAQGPLSGLLVAHKDIFYRRDRAPTCGVADPSGLPVLPPASVPDRLARAGAVELGVLNLAEFCFGTTGSNATFGDVRNPWDRSRVVGASSSGSGAAVAAGFVDASLGTDSGGSVRVPAALCGVVGLKPTHGLLPTEGVFPMVYALDCVGVLARSVADCRAVFAVAAEWAVQPTVPRPLRVGVPKNYYLDRLDPTVAAVFDAAIRTLEQGGAELVDLPVPEDEEVRSLLRLVMRTEGMAIHAGMMEERPGNYPLSVRKFLEAGRHVGARDYVDALRLRERYLDRSLSEVFGRVDVLVTPTVPVVAPTYEAVSDAGSEQGWRLITQLARCTQPATYAGLPALSVPFGIDAAHLPVGIQLIAPPHREDLLLGVAGLLEAAAPPGRPKVIGFS